MPKNKRIIFAIMGWGLGHATRCIPIIRSLMKENHVILASNGISATLLKQEFSSLKCIDYPDYAIKYPRNKMMFLPRITLQLPRIIIKLIKEYFQTQKVIKDENIDAIKSFLLKNRNLLIVFSSSRHIKHFLDIPNDKMISFSLQL